MLALSPPLFSTAYGWPLEDLINQNFQQNSYDISKGIEAHLDHTLGDFPSFDQICNDVAPQNSILMGEKAASGGAHDPTMVAKKINHNASERYRRKRVNDLYSFLRSLLPMSHDQKKKVSIPGTVTRALKYIPELQKEVEALICKKEKLYSSSSSTNIMIQENHDMKKQCDKNGIITRKSSPICSSLSVIDGKEVMIQIIYSNNHMNKDIEFLSKALEYLENQEDGLVLLNATTFKCFGEERLLNTLHLKVQGNQTIDAQNLKEKFYSFCQQSDEL